MFGSPRRSTSLLWFATGALLASMVGSTSTEAGAPAASTTVLAPSTLIAIAPCRLVDTRAETAVGPRHTPLVGGETYVVQVSGDNGNCSIPAGATAVALNIVTTNQTAAGFLSAWPADRARPLAASANWAAHQGPTPNGAQIALSADGRLAFFANVGAVDLVIDVTAYYTSDSRATPCAATQLWARSSCREQNFGVGAAAPTGIVSDGSNLWVASAGIFGAPPALVRVDPISGATTPYLVPEQVSGVAYDGTRIWAASVTALFRVDPSTGAFQRYALTGASGAIAFDGTWLWALSWQQSLTRVDPSSGAMRTFNLPAGTSPGYAGALTFDGRSLWVANAFTDNVTKIDPADPAGAVVIQLPNGSRPSGIVSDGAAVWTANSGTDSVSRIDPTSGTASSFSLPAAAARPTAITWDGTHLWTADYVDDTGHGGLVTRIDPATGAAIDVPLPDGASASFGITFDGRNVWVTNRDTNNVTRLPATG